MGVGTRARPGKVGLGSDEDATEPPDNDAQNPRRSAQLAPTYLPNRDAR